jgi:hypothetical protein
MGFSLSHQSKTNLLDIIGNHYSDSVVQAVKDGKNLQGTGDNWDMKIDVHDMQSSHQNQDLHYFASNLIVERVPCENLSPTAPRRDIMKLPNSVFLLSDEEEIKLREDFKVLVGRVLVAGIESLSFLKSVIPEHIPHKYQKEMSEKSIIVPLPMQLKDEKKYSDVVDILDYYENELEDIYAKANIIEKPAKQNEQQSVSIEGQSSLPDQPRAHYNRVDESDHMKVVSVPFGGDQMTRVRFAGAKDLRAGSHTAKERLDHCSPFVSELFHTKMSYLQVMHINNHTVKACSNEANIMQHCWANNVAKCWTKI